MLYGAWVGCHACMVHGAGLSAVTPAWCMGRCSAVMPVWCMGKGCRLSRLLLYGQRIWQGCRPRSQLYNWSILPSRCILVL